MFPCKQGVLIVFHGGNTCISLSCALSHLAVSRETWSVSTEMSSRYAGFIAISQILSSRMKSKSLGVSLRHHTHTFNSVCASECDCCSQSCHFHTLHGNEAPGTHAPHYICRDYLHFLDCKSSTSVAKHLLLQPLPYTRHSVASQPYLAEPHLPESSPRSHS